MLVLADDAERGTRGLGLEVQVVVAQSPVQVTDVLVEVVDLLAGSQLVFDRPAHMRGRVGDQVVDRHLGMTLLEQADQLERLEGRSAGGPVADDVHLQDADGRLRDVTERGVDERGQPAADLVLAEFLLLEDLADARCRRGAHPFDLEEGLAGQQHQGDDRVEPGVLDRLQQLGVAAERVGQRGHVGSQHERHVKPAF